jgi:hypothetical protein
MSLTISATEERALTLLGQGIEPSQVAAAIGVTPARISQLISDPEFAAKVADLRFKSLQKHNERDGSYDSLEDELLEKLKHMIPYMLKPMEVLRAIQVINGAKRRGASSEGAIQNQTTVVQLVLPATIMNVFTKQEVKVDINNQVIQAGDQSLVTAQVGMLQNLLKKSTDKGNQNEQLAITQNRDVSE